MPERDDRALDQAFSKASKQLINLINNKQVSDFIDADRNNIKQKFANLQNVKLVKDVTSEGFEGYFKPERFPDVDTQEIDNAINALHPKPDDVKTALNGTNDKNNLNITELVQGDQQEKTITQISRFIVLKQLLHFAKIRSHYEDAEDHIDHYPVTLGDEYISSRPHLIHATGLYCAYCESNLNDGHASQLDHKLPNDTFGERLINQWKNLVLACIRCNESGKSNRCARLTKDKLKIYAKRKRDVKLPNGEPKEELHTKIFLITT